MDFNYKVLKNNIESYIGMYEAICKNNNINYTNRRILFIVDNDDNINEIMNLFITNEKHKMLFKKCGYINLDKMNISIKNNNNNMVIGHYDMIISLSEKNDPYMVRTELSNGGFYFSMTDFDAYNKKYKLYEKLHFTITTELDLKYSDMNILKDILRKELNLKGETI